MRSSRFYSLALRIGARLLILCFWFVFIVLFLRWSGYFQVKFSGPALNILVWPQVLDAEFLQDFQKKTGVHVNISYVDHNEEMILKLESSPDHGYDLVMPSHYMLPTLVEKKLIKPIAQEKLIFWKEIYPTLLNIYSDPGNKYSVPFYWGILGIGVNRSFFHGEHLAESWDLVFRPEKIKSCISVISDIRELSLIAAQYLFGRIHDLKEPQIEQIIQLLLKQKKHVGLYTDGRTEYAIAAKTCPTGIVLLSDLMKVMREFPEIDFLIPQEGTFVIVDSFVLTAQTKKDELIYKLLNYLYTPEVLIEYASKFQFLPAVANVHPDVPVASRFLPTKEFFKRLRFFENVLSDEIIHHIWTSVRAR